MPPSASTSMNKVWLVTAIVTVCYFLTRTHRTHVSSKLLVTVQSRNADVAAVDGVICTMVKDENKHLAEWVQFHLLVGATKIVIYDDNSTVSPREVLHSFGANVIVHDVSAIGEVPAHLLPYADRSRPYILRQIWSHIHCAKTYGGGKGWLGVFDVDEYMFPCRRDISSSLWDAFNKRLNGTQAHAARVECLKFGFADSNQPLGPGTVQLAAHSRR